jgi:HEAT repeat protein
LHAAPISAILPPVLVPILRRALAKSPEDRYSSCDAMLDALKQARAALGEQSTDEVPRGMQSSDGPSTPHVPAVPPGAVPYPPQARLLVPALVRALKHADPVVRLGAVDALCRTPDESARPALQDDLADADAEVRQRARSAAPSGSARRRLPTRVPSSLAARPLSPWLIQRPSGSP